VNVLFAPNASVRLGITADHRHTTEPDFLVWQDRKLGVLEVDGPWHTGRAADDHERDRRLREHGVRVVERYPPSVVTNCPTTSSSTPCACSTGTASPSG
jgi:hypothetical protein